LTAAAVPQRRRRRWPWFIAAPLALLVGFAAGSWFIWLPEFRPELAADESYGVDVSNHQGRVDWSRVAADGIEFAYIKATEGGDFVDRRFDENWEGAGAAGIARGAYHFFTLCTPGSVQARNFLRTVPDDAEALAPAVDLELKGNCARRPSEAAVNRELATFLEMVEADTGLATILYIGDEFERRYPVRDELGRPLWLFRFLRRPNVAGWVMWQVDGFAHVEGVDGDVDLDVADVSRLRRPSGGR
jgi:lysozyme